MNPIENKINLLEAVYRHSPELKKANVVFTSERKPVS